MQTNSQALWAVSQSWLYLSHRLVPWLVLGILLALVGVFLLGRQWGLYQQHRHDPVNIGVLLQAFKTDHAKIEEFRLQMQSQLSTLNRQMGRVQAHITRVNLLGKSFEIRSVAIPRSLILPTSPHYLYMRARNPVQIPS